MIEPSLALEASFARTLLTWLATYLAHSTLLIAGVWGFTRWCPIDSLTRSLLWKLALVGGLFTATLQTGLGVEPLLGRVAVAEAAPLPPPPPPPLMAPPPPPPMPCAGAGCGHEMVVVEASCAGPACSRSVIVMRDGCDGEGCVGAAPMIVVHEEESPGGHEVTTVALSGPPGVAAPVSWPPPPDAFTPLPPSPPLQAAAVRPPAEPGEAWSVMLAGLLLAGMVASVARFGVTAWRLKRLLRGRHALTDGPLRERLNLLLLRARVPQRSVRLSVSTMLRSPIALASGEIVVPPQALELSPRQQEAMLAHELAHVVRRDPAWLVLAAAIGALLFFQPLHRVARRGMQEAAEELSDDWAVRHLGSGLHLARCLAEVAGWLAHGRAPGPLVSPMSTTAGSPLVRRVHRLLDAGGAARSRWTTARRTLLAVAVLLGVVFAAPGVSVAVAETPAPPPAEVEDLDAVAALEDVELAALEDLEFDDSQVAPVVFTHAAAPEAVRAGPTRQQQREARRAARLERRAARLRDRAGVPTHIRIEDGEVRIEGEGGRVHVIHRDHGAGPQVHWTQPPAWPAPPVMGPPPGWGGPVDAEDLARIQRDAERAARDAERAARDAERAARDDVREAARAEREAARIAREAAKIDRKELERMQREAERAARESLTLDREAIERMQRETVRALQLDREALERMQRETGRALQLDHEALERLEREAERAGRIDPQALERIRREAERAGRIDPQALERIRREARRVADDDDEDEDEDRVDGASREDAARQLRDSARRTARQASRASDELLRALGDEARALTRRGSERSDEELRSLADEARRFAERAPKVSAEAQQLEQAARRLSERADAGMDEKQRRALEQGIRQVEQQIQLAREQGERRGKGRAGRRRV
jgi:beta-lactamase regulating signal transducer with metallopeptidase domain